MHESKPATVSASFDRLADLIGDPAAVDFIRCLHIVSHTWDDLIDRDKDVSADRINEAFLLATVGLPLNPFFARHASMLVPVMQTGYLNWRAANDIEKSGDREALTIAHVVRCAIGDVALMCAALVHGTARASEIAAELRIITQQETLAAYTAEHVKEPAP